MHGFDFYTPTYVYFGQDVKLAVVAMVHRLGGARTIGSFQKLDQADIRSIYEAANRPD